MNTRFFQLALLCLASTLTIPQLVLAQPAHSGLDTSKRSLIKNDAGAYPGFTLYTPLGNKNTFLLNMSGEVVHQWKSDHQPANSVFIQKNGDLMRSSKVMGNQRFGDFGPSGGRLERFSWEGEQLWDYIHSNDQEHQHHDIRPLPNGNVLLVAWYYVSKEDAIAAGRKPEAVGDQGIWPDKIVEVKQTGEKTAEVIWEWNTWDHIIQDFDKTKANFGDVAAHPELVDVNFAPRAHTDWLHTNSVAYNPELDQIILSVRAFNEVWVIDHGTTTEEAASHAGGKCGKGGDLLYRWGNPAAYRAGTQQDQTLFSQHDARWVNKGYPGAGNITIFNNGPDRPDGEYSTVEEITPPLKADGTYEIEQGKAFAPKTPAWSYRAQDKMDFYSAFISGAERLANGNTLVCSGSPGDFFEVTPEKKIVWRYINPIFTELPPPPGGRRGGAQPPPGGKPAPGGKSGGKSGGAKSGGKKGKTDGDGPNADDAGPPSGRGGPGPHIVFRVKRYAPDYPAFEGKNLDLKNEK